MKETLRKIAVHTSWVYAASLMFAPSIFAQVQGPRGTPPGSPVPGPAGSIPTPTPTSGSGELVNPLKVGSLPDLLNLILDAVIQLGIIVLVIALVWIGFLFVKAQGNPEKLKEARNAFIWTIIGGLILLGAKGIMTVIKSTVDTL